MDIETTANCLYEMRIDGIFVGCALECLAAEVQSSLTLTSQERVYLLAELEAIGSGNCDPADGYEAIVNILSSHKELECVPSRVLAKTLSESG